MAKQSKKTGQQHTRWQKFKNIYHLCNAYFFAFINGFPGNKLKVIGVTGTDGKTTTTSMIFHILKHAGVKVALINTIQAQIGDRQLATGLHVTTQSPSQLQPLLKNILRQGFETVILETTSHGLEQHRVRGIGFDIAVVTNIKEDHLDYHGTQEHYLRAKAKLFGYLAKGKDKGINKTAVLNFTDSSFPVLAQIPCTSQIAYNCPEANPKNFDHCISTSDTIQNAEGIAFNIWIDRTKHATTLPLLGLYNTDNIQAAIGAALAYGLSPEKILESIPLMPQIKGRMQKINAGQNFLTIVDFAHTPAALQKALQTLRSLQPTKLIVVFGCAGERDKGRRKMGEVAVKIADISIFTNEDNRSEDIHTILNEISASAKTAGGVHTAVDNVSKTYIPSGVFFTIPDRKQAIDFAIRIAPEGSIVVFTGKGHEQSLNIDNREFPWDEAKEVRASIEKKLAQS